MKTISMMLSILATGAVLQNVIFARGFCTDDILHSTRTCRGMLRLGLTTALITVLSTLLAWTMRRFFSGMAFWETVKWLVYLLCVVVSYILARVVLVFQKKGDKPTREQAELLLRAGFNGAAYGIVLIVTANYTSLWQMLVYAIGGCLGLTAAQLLIHAGHERIGLCAVPKPFAGVPVVMIYIGILSLAIYGLIGHQLPT